MKAYKASDKTFDNQIKIDFQKDKKLLILINLISVLSFPFFYVVFYYIAYLTGTIHMTDRLLYYLLFESLPLKYLLMLLGILLIISVVHELIHGLFFFIITKEKPVFGYKDLFAYAGAPDWYIKKKYFYIISISPFVILSFAGIAALFFTSSVFLSVVLVPFSAHAAACIGDLWMSIMLLNKPEETYVNDTGLSATINY